MQETRAARLKRAEFPGRATIMETLASFNEVFKVLLAISCIISAGPEFSGHS
jgi:hypothetical protein